ncbi:40S ribosomal protein S16, partial [Linnemannia gamsii]
MKLFRSDSRSATNYAQRARQLAFIQTYSQCHDYAINIDNSQQFGISLVLTQIGGQIKTATAVAHCKAGKGLIRLNGSPIELVEPDVLKFKVYEPILRVGSDKFANVDIRIR